MPLKHLIDIPQENRHTRNLNLTTAVSIESPDLFRIPSVPCIDRGPDQLRPPVTYKHWKDGENTGGYKTGDSMPEPRKKTANFARPTSVSADTPIFFKIPGVAVNRSSAITGVEELCSPPPAHQPFKLPATFMHYRDERAEAADPVLVGQWRETNSETGQWGYMTQQFQEALKKMRQREAQAQRHLKPTATANATGAIKSQSGIRTRKMPSQGHHHDIEQSAKHQGQHDYLRQRVTPDSPKKPARTASSTQLDCDLEIFKAEADDKKGALESRRDADPKARRASAAEIFMSRLEGKRAPQNRRESIAAFKRILQDCPTNNSSQLFSDRLHWRDFPRVRSFKSGSNDSATATAALRKKAVDLKGVLARRKEAHEIVSKLMSSVQGSYMLSPEADESKILLGRRKSGLARSAV